MALEEADRAPGEDKKELEEKNQSVQAKIDEVTRNQGGNFPFLSVSSFGITQRLIVPFSVVGQLAKYKS